MSALLAVSLLLAGVGGAAAPDTTLEVRRGDRLVIEGLTGELVVEAWDRSILSIAGGGGRLRRVGVTRSGSVVTVRPDDPKDRRVGVEMILRVPTWMDLAVEGREVEVHVRGVEGEISVRNVSGDIVVHGASRRIDLSTVEGEIEVRGARGPVRARSRGDDVTLRDVRGDVDVGTGDGDLHLEDIVASELRAETLDGDVFFSGLLAQGGSYAFSVHDGDATLVLPRDTDAHFSVATFDGEFTSEFPVTLQGYQGRGVFEFTLGQGSARMDVRVFDGEIRLRQRAGR